MLLNHVHKFVPAIGKCELLEVLKQFKSGNFKTEMELIHKKTIGKELNEFTFRTQFHYAWAVFSFGREET